MSQPPQQPLGNQPPNPQQGHPQQPGYPAPGQPPQGYPQQGQPQQGYPLQGGYPPQQGYPQQGVYSPQQGYAPAGYGPQGPAGRPPGSAPKKSSALILGIVGGAVALLVLIGAVFLVFGGKGDDPAGSTITASPPSVPPDDPSTAPTTDPSPKATPSTKASTAPSPSSSSSSQPTGKSVDIGNGVSVVPAKGWKVVKTTKTLAELSDGESNYLGQTTVLDEDTNAGQVCTAWHKQVAEDASGAKYTDPKTFDAQTSKLKAASCGAVLTVSSGQGTSQVLLVSVVSVRPADGLTALSTAEFTTKADSEQLGKDFETMVASVLETQASS